MRWPTSSMVQAIKMVAIGWQGMVRFLVTLKSKDGKPRLVDDDHESGTNGCNLTYETITPPGMIASVAGGGGTSGPQHSGRNDANNG